MSKTTVDLLKSISDKLERTTESMMALAKAWAEAGSNAKRFVAAYTKPKR